MWQFWGESPIREVAYTLRILLSLASSFPLEMRFDDYHISWNLW